MMSISFHFQSLQAIKNKINSAITFQEKVVSKKPHEKRFVYSGHIHTRNQLFQRPIELPCLYCFFWRNIDPLDD